MFNQIVLVGNAGRDAEIRNTSSGRQVASFSLAVNRNRQVDGEWRTDTEWFQVSAWGNSAEYVAERVRKGTKVFVSGRLSSRTYVGDDGMNRFSMDVNAYRVISFDRSSAPSNGQAETDSVEPPENASEYVEDLPW